MYLSTTNKGVETMKLKVWECNKYFITGDKRDSYPGYLHSGITK